MDNNTYEILQEQIKQLMVQVFKLQERVYELESKDESTRQV